MKLLLCLAALIAAAVAVPANAARPSDVVIGVIGGTVLGYELGKNQAAQQVIVQPRAVFVPRQSVFYDVCRLPHFTLQEAQMYSEFCTPQPRRTVVVNTITTTQNVVAAPSPSATSAPTIKKWEMGKKEGSCEAGQKEVWPDPTTCPASPKGGGKRICKATCVAEEKK